MLEAECGALKDKRVKVGNDGTLDAEYLLSNDGEHLQLDPVELVKAGPRPCTG